MVTSTQPSATSTGLAAFTDLRLSNTTLQAITSMGISEPTPIQAAALPALLEGRDVIGQARTGSGKTLTFGIPAVEFVDPRQRVVQVLVLTPTRELAVQVGGVLEELGQAKGVTVGLIFGGRAMGPQRDLLRRGVHVVVGTPGRVLDLLNQGALRLDRVRFLILDEADEMLDRGFAPDVERIIGRTSTARQTALFSATVPDWVRSTADKHMDRPIVVAVDPDPDDIPVIEHVAYDVPADRKLDALKDLLDHRSEDGSVIVFGRTKHGVKALARRLSADGYPVAALQGNLSQNARDQVMADFRSRTVPILLATNVAARGLDVTHVEQVINVELPESPDLLTHRIGRTGRMGRPGQAITLLGPEDGAKWRQLERGLGRRIPRAPWAGAAAALNGDEGQEPWGAPTEASGARRPAPAASSRTSISQPTERAPRRASPLAPRPASPVSSPPPRRPAASTPKSEAAFGPNRARRPSITGATFMPRQTQQNDGSQPAPRAATNGIERRGSDAPMNGRDGRDARNIRDAQNGHDRRDRRPRTREDIPTRSFIADPSPRSTIAEPDTRGPNRPGYNLADTPRLAPSTSTTQPSANGRPLHHATCSECGGTAELNFRPDPTRPVFCADCFASRRTSRRPADSLVRA